MAESESILLQRFAKSGDTEAFSEIVKRYAGLVYGSALRVLGDKTRAADATQETFFQLLHNPASITGSLAGWLYKVAAGKAIDQIRKDSRRKNSAINQAEVNKASVKIQ